ncbi:MAG: histidine kinase N-terminal 7TM domain-containing protein, partial [Patescibacteria group bacterium]
MYSFNIFSIISIFGSSLYLLLGIFSLFKNPKRSENRLFFLMSFTFFIWGLGEGMGRASNDYQTAYFWAVYVMGFGATINPPVLLHFWTAFSENLEGKKSKSKLPILIFYIPSIIFTAIYLFYPKIFIEEIVRFYWGYSVIGSPLYIFYMFYVFVYISMAAFLIFRTAFKTSGNIKKQAQYIGGALFFSLFVGAITQISRPIFNFPIPEFSVATSIVFACAVTYAINKYGLMTISTRLVAENIISTIEDYVIAIDKEMKIVFINNSALRDLEYKKEELINRPISTILLTSISKFSYNQALKRFPLQNYPAEIVSKNDDKISVSANISILKEGSGIIGFAFVLRDMRQTEELIKGLKQKTEELEVAKKELEQRNEEFE